MYLILFFPCLDIKRKGKKNGPIETGKRIRSLDTVLRQCDDLPGDTVATNFSLALVDHNAINSQASSNAEIIEGDDGNLVTNYQGIVVNKQYCYF